MEDNNNKNKPKKTQGKNIGCILYPDSKLGNFNSGDQLYPIFNFYSATCKVAYILHDKDKKEDGTDIKPHYHCIIQSKDTLSLRKFQETWKISGYCSEILDNWEASVQYLAHLNPGYDKADDGGHIYEIKEIRSNFTLDKYFNSLKSSDPEYVQLLKIINWASHNHANYYQILKYAGEHGYFSTYRKCYRMIYDILGSKNYVYESQLVDLDEIIPEDFIKE